MNERELMITRNNNARKLEHTSKIHRGCIRINRHNTLEHELAKFLLALEFINAGMEVITEAEVEGKERRYDVYVIDDGSILEIENDPKIITKKLKGEHVRYYSPEEVLKKYGLEVKGGRLADDEKK